MKRRQFIFSTATLALVSGCGLLPRQTPRLPRVGILCASAATDQLPNDETAGLKQGLEELGYANGQAVVFETRFAEGNVALLPELANNLVQSVDVIVTVGGTAATAAARQATSSVPIVFVVVNDPVGRGFVTGLANPGGNLTGITNAPPTVLGKLLELLVGLVPGLSRVAFLTNLDPVQGPLAPSQVPLTTAAASALGLQLKILDVRSPDRVDPALNEILAWQAQAMLMFGGPGALADATPHLAAFQLQSGIPLGYTTRGGPVAGALLSFGVNAVGEGRRAAVLVDKILKGASPGRLPVEQPTEFDLVVNQKTAAALGITIPPEIAQQVTEWVT
jgi:putative ABC transport system substrate-binding protein